MNTYYFTFGQKYRVEPHPAGGHPDGWFEVEAYSPDQARRAMTAECGTEWATQYDGPGFTKRFFPLGCLREIDGSTA